MQNVFRATKGNRNNPKYPKTHTRTITKGERMSEKILQEAQNAQTLNTQEEAQSNQTSQESKQKSNKEELEPLKEKLQELENATLQLQARENTKQQLRELEEKIPDFKASKIIETWQELAKSNLPLAKALDNPSGWEILHYATLAKETQSAKDTHKQIMPDKILEATSTLQTGGGEDNAVLERITKGMGSFADFGKIFN